MSGSVHEADITVDDRHPVLFIEARISKHRPNIVEPKLRIGADGGRVASRSANPRNCLLSKSVSASLSDGGGDVEVVVVVEDAGVFEADDKGKLTCKGFTRYKLNLRDRVEISVKRNKPVTSVNRICSVCSPISSAYEVSAIFIHPVVDGAHHSLKLAAVQAHAGVHRRPVFFGEEVYLF